MQGGCNLARSEDMNYREPTLEELTQAFGVKISPVVTFWFIPSYCVSEGLAEYPKDFGSYKLFQKKEIRGRLWSCYAKKEVKGCVSDRYWKA